MIEEKKYFKEERKHIHFGLLNDMIPKHPKLVETPNVCLR